MSGAAIGVIEDVFANPALLTSVSPGQLLNALGGLPANWLIERLGSGTHEGQGMLIREYGLNGDPTGRMIRWHPASWRHGWIDYWRVSSPRGGKSGILPAGPWDLPTDWQPE